LASPVVTSAHLKVDLVKGRRYARIVRSIREGARVRNVTLVQLGAISPEQEQLLRDALARRPIVGTSLTGLLERLPIRKLRTLQYGREALGHALWRQLGLHTIVLECLNGLPRKARTAQLLETMVLNRLSDPTSKLGILDWLDTSSTPMLLGYAGRALHDNLLYRAMDALWARRDTLERKLFERVVQPRSSSPRVLCHDLTSSYYEGEGGPLAQFGYSRDHRGDRPQITWGMVVTPEGLPITIQVYPGNTTDNTTVGKMRERLTQVFGLKDGIYVGDRGMKTTEVLDDLHAHGFHYVLAEVNRSVEEVILHAQKLPPVAVGHQNVAREVIDREGGRFIVLLNEERRRTELEVLEHRIAQGRAILEQLRRSWAKRPRHHHALLRQAQAALAAKGLSDLFEIDWDEATVQGLTAKLKEGRLRQRRLAGWWVLTTDTELPAEEVVKLYTGLAVIEQGWRELKSVLEVRPLRHRLDRRVGAHLQLCVLAYLLEKYLELAVRRGKVEAEKGEPLTGARAIERFARLTADEQEVGEGGPRRWIFTDLDPLHGKILEALGVDPGRFQRGWARLS
jgi:transposase